MCIDIHGIAYFSVRLQLKLVYLSIKTISHISVSLHLAERNLLRRLQISATIKDFKLIKDDIMFLSEYVTNAKFLHILRKCYKILFMLSK